MKLDITQEMHIANVFTADQAWRSAKLNANARGRELARKEVAAYLAARDHEVRLALDAGVPKLQIRRDGLSTDSGATLKESLERTETAARMLVGVVSDPMASRYALDTKGVLTITLDGAALDQAAEEQDSTANDVANAGANEAAFLVNTRADHTRYIEPVTSNWFAALSLLHPVVAWAAVPANEAEALDWVSKQ